MQNIISCVNIRKRKIWVEESILQELRKYDAATAYKAMGYQGAMDYQIKPLMPSMKLCGRALTVRTVDGDNLMVHKALQMAGGGDVIVVDAGGEGSRSATLGDVMVIQARYSGVEGFVMNSSVLDSQRIKELGVPVFSNGIAIKGAEKASTGWINYPVSVGGVVVNPGDIVLGDGDGVVVIPAQWAEEVLEKCKKREEYEKIVLERMKHGEHLYDISNYEEILQKLGCTAEA